MILNMEINLKGKKKTERDIMIPFYSHKALCVPDTVVKVMLRTCLPDQNTWAQVSTVFLNPVSY